MVARRTATLAIVNPAAGGGRCGKRAAAALGHLERAGLEITTRETAAPRDATRIAREAYAAGYRRMIAVGGDGTCWEVLNGIAPEGLGESNADRVRLGVLPLGTGNSFLREFTRNGAEHSLQALIEDRWQPSDVLVLTHDQGRVYYVNLFGFGFAANVTINTQRGRYKRWGNVGYILGVLDTVARLSHPALAHRVAGELDTDPMTFLCVCNSRFTAGSMMMAPDASVSDGLADVIHVAPLGRLAILKTFPKIYRGTHLAHPAVSARAVPRIEFETREAVDVMVDGEILHVVPRSIEVLPRALEVCA